MNKPQAELVIRDVDISTAERLRELAKWLRDQADSIQFYPEEFDPVYHALFMKKRAK